MFVAARALGALKEEGLGSECSGGNVDCGVVGTGGGRGRAGLTL